MFAEQVRILRESLGWTQSDLVDRMRKAGLEYVNQSTLSRIENGSRPVRLMESHVLSQLFDRTVLQMMRPWRQNSWIVEADQFAVKFRHDIVALFEATQQYDADRIEARRRLRSISEQFGDGADLDADTRKRYLELSALFRELSTTSVEDAIGNGKGGGRGQHQEAP